MSLTEALSLSLSSTGKVGHCDAEQKSSGNGVEFTNSFSCAQHQLLLEETDS